MEGAHPLGSHAGGGLCCRTQRRIPAKAGSHRARLAGDTLSQCIFDIWARVSLHASVSSHPPHHPVDVDCCVSTVSAFGRCSLCHPSAPSNAQVWGFGGVSITMDNSTQLVRAQIGDRWAPVSLDALLAEQRKRAAAKG